MDQMQHPAARDLLPTAARRVTEVVEQMGHARDDRWGQPTPCTQWSTRDLLNHLVAEHLWVPHLLSGATLAQVGDRYDGDVLGAQPQSSWESAIVGSLQAWATVHTDDQPVHVSAGVITTGVYAAQMLVDLTVHGWDLARGAGVGYDPDPEAVQAVLADWVPPSGQGHGSHLFAAPVEPPHGADGFTRLLALTGRDPAWQG